MLENVRDVAGGRVLGDLDRATPVRRRIEERLDRLLLRVRELVALGREELDAVVLGRVVRGREDDAEILREKRDRRCREHAAADRDPARGDDALDDRSLERRARAARVATDEDTPATCPRRRRSAEPLDEVEGQRVADNAANAIGSEVLSRHGNDRRRAHAARLRLARTSVRASAWRTAAPCAPCAGRPSCARPVVRHV